MADIYRDGSARAERKKEREIVSQPDGRTGRTHTQDAKRSGVVPRTR